MKNANVFRELNPSRSSNRILKTHRKRNKGSKFETSIDKDAFFDELMFLDKRFKHTWSFSKVVGCVYFSLHMRACYEHMTDVV